MSRSALLAAVSEDAELEVILCGPEEVVVPFAADRERVTAKVTTEEIGMAEHPSNAPERMLRTSYPSRTVGMWTVSVFTSADVISQ